jgi:GNAT superfamily N-acetyltransferase
MNWYKFSQKWTTALEPFLIEKSGDPDTGEFCVNAYSKKDGYKDRLVGHSVFTANEALMKKMYPGWASVWEDEDKLKPGEMWALMIDVDPEYRRQGIATALYNLAEKITGRKIIRTPAKTPESDALWQQKERPFGKQQSIDSRLIFAQKIVLDTILVQEAELLQNAANVHKMRNLISTYMGAYKLLKEKYSDKIEGIFYRKEQELRNFVLSERAKKYQFV